MNGVDSKSYWLETTRPTGSALTGDIVADVCIVGSGIAGLTMAYLALKAGRRVVVLEADERIVAGESGRTTAHLTNAFDDRYAEIERIHGDVAAMLVADSHSRAIDRIETIVKDEAIECDFARIDGYLFAAATEGADVLQSECAAAQRAGLQVEMVTHVPGVGMLGCALRFPRQAQLHPLKYLAGLAAAIVRLGGEIYTGARVVDVEDGSPVVVTTALQHTIRANVVALATNTPAIDRVAMHTKQAAYRSYAVGLDIAKDALPPALYWDTHDPYHYVRLASPELLIVGGEDHKTGQADDAAVRFDRLEQWARQFFPGIGARRWNWSGQILEPADGIAFIGHNPGDANVFIATGDSGNGMTHGTIAGLLFADLLAGKSNPWAGLYDPRRKPPVRSLGQYARENFNVGAQYADWVAPAEVGSVDAIPPGSGAIVRDKLNKLAVYRDSDGALHGCDAACPHLGCVVQWNSLERSWDCPCHGSRFDRFGHVLAGPATRDLIACDVRH